MIFKSVAKDALCRLHILSRSFITAAIIRADLRVLQKRLSSPRRKLLILDELTGRFTLVLF